MNSIERLKESEARLRRAELASKSGNWELHIDSKKMHTSEGAALIYGVKKVQFEYSVVKNIVLPQYRPLLDAALKNLIENDKPYDLEFKIKKVDTGEIEDIHSVAVFDKEKRILFGVIQNITERKKMADELRDSEARHASMISNISDVIGIIGIDGCMKYKSPNVEKWFGWKPADLEGTDGWLNVHPDDLQRIQKEFFILLEKERSSITLEYKYKCKDGSYKPIELTAINLSNDPIIKGVLLNYHDITDRKQSEDAVRASEKNYRLLAENISDVIWVFNIAKNKFTYISSSVTQMRGLTVEEALQESIDESLTSESAREMKKLIPSRLEEFQKGATDLNYDEFEQFRKDGSTIWVEIGTKFQFAEDGTIEVRGVSRNITERKQAEQELKNHRQHLEKQVKARTGELEKKNKELERFNQLFVGREFRIKELRIEVEMLKKQLSEKDQ